MNFPIPDGHLPLSQLSSYVIAFNVLPSLNRMFHSFIQALFNHRDLYTGGLYSLNLSTMIDFNTLRSGYFHFFPVSDDYTHTSSNSVYWLFQTEQFPPFSRS